MNFDSWMTIPDATDPRQITKHAEEVELLILEASGFPKKQ